MASSGASKRPRKDRKPSPKGRSSVVPNQEVQAAFLSYRHELDDKQNLHERIFKLNRELTIASKQIICLLHRVSVHSSDEERAAKLAEAEEKLRELRFDKLRAIAEETVDSDVHARAFSGGVQEYIEALTFFHFLKEESIPNHNRSIELCSTEDGPRFPLSTENYVLGVGDLPGELMRSATNAAGAGDRELPVRLLGVLQDFAGAFQLLTAGSGRDLGRKILTLSQSVCKVERLCYSLHVRGEEALLTHLVAEVTRTEDPGED